MGVMFEADPGPNDVAIDRERMGEMIILHPDHGDLKVIWDRNNSIEVDAAREQFNSLKKKGYTAYSVRGEKGEKGEIVHEFDAQAERLILAPRTTGG